MTIDFSPPASPTHQSRVRSESLDSVWSNAPQPEKKKPYWNGFKVHFAKFDEAFFKVGIHLVIGFIFQLIIPSIAPPFFGFFGGACLVRLSVKIIKTRKPFSLDKTIEKAHAFEKKYLLILRIALLFAVCLSLLSPIIGGITGGLLGTIPGLNLGMAVAEKKFEKEQKETKKSGPEAP